MLLNMQHLIEMKLNAMKDVSAVVLVTHIYHTDRLTGQDP